MDQEEKINWDKLLKHIEDQDEIQNDQELNQQELEILLLAEEINMRLQEKDPKLKFPIEEGWEELKLRYKEKEIRSKRLKLYRVLAVAAALLLVLAPVWWLFLQKNGTAHPIEANQVQLTLSNGETVALDTSHSDILKSEGVTMNGTKLVYKKEEKLPEVRQKTSLNVLVVPKGKYTRLELGDGTQVWLNSGSKLSYQVPFSPDKREMALEGEAYFKVSHNASRPFVVHVKDLEIKVLGTEFNVNSFGPSIQTALIKGKVNLQSGSHSIRLMPGELGLYKGLDGSLEKNEADLKVYTAWKDGEIYFNNNSLDEIASRLEREFDLHFSFQDESLKNLHFTIDMPRNEDVVEKILNNIQLSTNQVKFVVKGNRIRVQHK